MIIILCSVITKYVYLYGVWGFEKINRIHASKSKLFYDKNAGSSNAVNILFQPIKIYFI